MGVGAAHVPLTCNPFFFLLNCLPMTPPSQNRSYAPGECGCIEN